VKERFLRGYFTESLPIGEPEVLDRLALEAGLPPAEVAEVLATDRFAVAVRAGRAACASSRHRRRAVLRDR
jgi:predicted DsbA family dithiol-disulfide isomerase